MREKIVLKRRSTPKIVTLPNGTTFTARYKRISRKNLPTNIKVKKTRTVKPRTHRNRLIGQKNQRKRVSFTPSTSLRNRLKRIKRHRESRHAQTGSALASNLAIIGLMMGNRAIDSALGKKTDN